MKALVLVDIQNDFLPDGALAVPHGDEVVAVANQLMDDYQLIVATKDWHPADHGSFLSQHPGHRVGDTVVLEGLNQVVWPDHCVQGSRGAGFATGLDANRIKHVVQKGTDRNIDSYSGFFDNARRRATGLAMYLRQERVVEVHLVGLATDYCIQFTALDAMALGFRTAVFTKGVRAVNLQDGDGKDAIESMSAAGVAIVRGPA